MGRKQLNLKLLILFNGFFNIFLLRIDISTGIHQIHVNHSREQYKFNIKTKIKKMISDYLSSYQEILS